MSSMMTRRDFLKTTGLVCATFAFARYGKAAGRDQPILVVIFQRGAADGVSMAVPFGDPFYYSVRPQIAIPEPRRSATGRAIDLDGFFALHPALDSLKPIYDEGHLAVVHASGSPSNTRSHFDAQDYMESGIPDLKSGQDGWLNRYLQIHADVSTTPFRAVAIGPNVPRSLMGPARCVPMNRIADFRIRGGAATAQIEEAFAGIYPDTFEAVKMLRAADPQQYSPANGVEYPQSPFGQALLQIAQLAKADVGLEIAFANVGGWDTHANQGSSQGQLANRLKDFGDSLAAMYRDLGDRMRNVVVITMTEFGRSIRQNGSGGTDHGHASCMFVAGGSVKGGQVYGRWPGLSPQQLFEGRDLALTTDFREVLAEILVSHMGLRDVSKVFPEFRQAAPIGLFRG